MQQDPRAVPTLPSPSESDDELTLTHIASPLPEFASSQPPMHVAPTEAQLRMQETLPPLPRIGGVRDLLALAGGVALDGGNAMESERCSSTEYRGEPTFEDLSKSDTDQVPAFHFDRIIDMSDDEVAAELAALVATEGARVERRILLYLVRRHFALGLAAYGPVRLHDGRDNVKEMREEAADFLFYWGKEQLEREHGVRR